MQVRSLGYRTDLIFHRFAGEVLDRGDYLVIRSPRQQGFYWGNLLLFPAAPGAGDYERWEGLFREEFRDLAGVRHMTFGWDDPEGGDAVLEPFLAAGFRYEPGAVLSTSEARAPARGAWEELEVRPISGDEEWAEACRCQVACRDPELSEEAYQGFVARRMTGLRAMVEAGLGVWIGAFLEDRQVGNLGIFQHDGVGRFQTVCTHPGFRGRGVCSNLVYRTSLLAFEELGCQTLVIVSESGSQAERIYRSVGYHAEEVQLGLCRWPA